MHLCVGCNSETGEWFVLVQDLIACGAAGASEEEALAKIPRAIREYRDFVLRHGGSEKMFDLRAGEPVVVERVVVADEGIFEFEREEASVEEIERTIEFLTWTRADLLGTLTRAPQAAFVWDPPYKNYASWANWRSIEQVLAHIAICETRYYLRWIGYDPGPAPAVPESPEPGSREWYAALGRDWQALLARTRKETISFLRSVAHSVDRRRLHEEPGNCWSLRKVLARLVSHEQLHTKNIRRILRDFSLLEKDG